jgi:hypothetical protein
MRTEMVLEMLVYSCFNCLTQLVVHGSFVAISCHASFRFYTYQIYYKVWGYVCPTVTLKGQVFLQLWLSLLGTTSCSQIQDWVSSLMAQEGLVMLLIAETTAS